MGESVEKYLVDKLHKKLNDTNSKVLLFHGRFQKLVDSLCDFIGKSSPAGRSSIRKELYRLNNVYEECQMLSKKQSFRPLETVNLQIRRTLDKISQELRPTLRTIEPEHDNIDETETICCPLPKKTETSQVDPSRVYGLKNQVALLERMLLQPGISSEPFNAIAVTGVRGVGKTTLARLVFNEERVKSRFLPRVWVSMSRQLDGTENSRREAKAPNRDDNSRREAIAKKLLTHLGVRKDTIQSIESKGITGLLYALHLQLIGKRYLIVLDDVRDRDEWYKELVSAPGDEKEWGERLAYGLPKGYGGSVIITSRHEEVGNGMVGRENVVRLQPLTGHDSCWRIFKDEVERDGVALNSENMEKLRLEVQKKTGGLPLAAKVMGQLLFQKLKTEAMVKHDHDRIEDDEADDCGRGGGRGNHQRLVQE